MPELRYQNAGEYDATDQERFEQFTRSLFYKAGIAPIEPGRPLDLQVATGLVDPYPVNATSARTPFRYMRRLSHVRRDRADICVLFLVLGGTIKATHRGRRATLKRDDFYLVRSIHDHEFEVFPGATESYSHLCIALPPELVIDELGWEELLGQVIQPPPAASRLARTWFLQLFEEGGTIAADVADALVRAMLLSISTVVGRSDEPRSGGPVDLPSRSPRVMRAHQVERYLELHVTNPDLTAGMVAKACSMSTRYLAMLLSARGTSFQRLVRDLRIAKMREWLGSEKLDHEPIATLSYRAGFKSHSHFSATFKAYTGLRPSQYRARRHKSVASPSRTAIDGRA